MYVTSLSGFFRLLVPRVLFFFCAGAIRRLTGCRSTPLVRTHTPPNRGTYAVLTGSGILVKKLHYYLVGSRFCLRSPSAGGSPVSRLLLFFLTDSFHNVLFFSSVLHRYHIGGNTEVIRRSYLCTNVLFSFLIICILATFLSPLVASVFAGYYPAFT